MIHLRKERFPPYTYSKIKLRKIRPFAITKRVNNNSYTVELPADTNMSNTFNISDINSYYPPDDQDDKAIELEASSSSTTEEYDAGAQHGPNN